MRKSKHADHKSAYVGLGLATMAAAGAGAAYFLDPRSGRRRRALVRDRTSRLARQSRDFVAKASRDARQRVRGLYEESANRFRKADTDDTILEQRVRAELGRLSTHPGAIEVSSNAGTVRLRGDALEVEVPQALAGVQGVRGVKDVVNEMRVHQDADSIPCLQGEGNNRPARLEYFQENWSPAPRLLAGATGLAFMLEGFRRRSPLGLGLATVGAALLGRSVSNTPLTRLFGLGADAEDGVLVQKTIAGHTVARIFGRGPKRQIDRDLARFKTFIETGRRPRDSAVARQTQH